MDTSDSESGFSEEECLYSSESEDELPEEEIEEWAGPKFERVTAEQYYIDRRTVRRHISNIFDTLANVTYVLFKKYYSLEQNKETHYGELLRNKPSEFRSKFYIDLFAGLIGTVSPNSVSLADPPAQMPSPLTGRTLPCHVCPGNSRSKKRSPYMCGLCK